ncbi:hypothetical protein FI667_g7590, partial [Globisporangium splendens]
MRHSSSHSSASRKTKPSSSSSSSASTRSDQAGSGADVPAKRVWSIGESVLVKSKPIRRGKVQRLRSSGAIDIFYENGEIEERVGKDRVEVDATKGSGARKMPPTSAVAMAPARGAASSQAKASPKNASPSRSTPTSKVSSKATTQQPSASSYARSPSAADPSSRASNLSINIQEYSRQDQRTAGPKSQLQQQQQRVQSTASGQHDKGMFQSARNDEGDEQAILFSPVASSNLVSAAPQRRAKTADASSSTADRMNANSSLAAPPIRAVTKSATAARKPSAGKYSDMGEALAENQKQVADILDRINENASDATAVDRSLGGTPAQKRRLWSIGLPCANFIESTDLFVRRGIVDILAEALSRFPEDAILQASTCGCLAVLAQSSNASKNLMLQSYGDNPNVVQLVLSSLAVHCEYSNLTRQVQIYACEAVLIELSDYGGSATSTALIGSIAGRATVSAVELLVSLLRQSVVREDEKVTCVLGALLLCLAADSTLAADSLREYGVISDLSVVVAKYPIGEGIIRFSAAALRAIAATSLRHSPSKRVHQTARVILEDELCHTQTPTGMMTSSQRYPSAGEDASYTERGCPALPTRGSKVSGSRTTRNSSRGRSKSPTSRSTTGVTSAVIESGSFGHFSSALGETPGASFFTAMPVGLLAEFRGQPSSKLQPPRTREELTKPGGLKKRASSKTMEERDRLLVKTYGNPSYAGLQPSVKTNRSTSPVRGGPAVDFGFGSDTSRFSPLHNNYVVASEIDGSRFVIPPPLLSSEKSGEQYTSVAGVKMMRTPSGRLTPIVNEKVKISITRVPSTAGSGSAAQVGWIANSSLEADRPQTAVAVAKTKDAEYDRQGGLNSAAYPMYDVRSSPSARPKSPSSSARKRTTSSRSKSTSPKGKESLPKGKGSLPQRQVVSEFAKIPADETHDMNQPMAELHEFAQQLLKEEARISSLFPKTSPKSPGVNRMSFSDKLHKMIEFAESSMHERSIGPDNVLVDPPVDVTDGVSSGVPKRDAAIAGDSVELPSIQKSLPSARAPMTADGKPAAERPSTPKAKGSGYKQSRSPVSTLRKPHSTGVYQHQIDASTLMLPDLKSRIPFGFDEVETSIVSPRLADKAPMKVETQVVSTGDQALEAIQLSEVLPADHGGALSNQSSAWDEVHIPEEVVPEEVVKAAIVGSNTEQTALAAHDKEEVIAENIAGAEDSEMTTSKTVTGEFMEIDAPAIAEEIVGGFPTKAPSLSYPLRSNSNSAANSTPEEDAKSSSSALDDAAARETEQGMFTRGEDMTEMEPPLMFGDEEGATESVLPLEADRDQAPSSTDLESPQAGKEQNDFGDSSSITPTDSYEKIPLFETESAAEETADDLLDSELTLETSAGAEDWIVVHSDLRTSEPRDSIDLESEVESKDGTCVEPPSVVDIDQSLTPFAGAEPEEPISSTEDQSVDVVHDIEHIECTEVTRSEESDLPAESDEPGATAEDSSKGKTDEDTELLAEINGSGESAQVEPAVETIAQHVASEEDDSPCIVMGLDIVRTLTRSYVGCGIEDALIEIEVRRKIQLLIPGILMPEDAADHEAQVDGAETTERADGLDEDDSKATGSDDAAPWLAKDEDADQRVHIQSEDAEVCVQSAVAIAAATNVVILSALQSMVDGNGSQLAPTIKRANPDGCAQEGGEREVVLSSSRVAEDAQEPTTTELERNNSSDETDGDQVSVPLAIEIRRTVGAVITTSLEKVIANLPQLVRNDSQQSAINASCPESQLQEGEGAGKENQTEELLSGPMELSIRRHVNTIIASCLRDVISTAQTHDRRNLVDGTDRDDQALLLDPPDVSTQVDKTNETESKEADYSDDTESGLIPVQLAIAIRQSVRGIIAMSLEGAMARFLPGTPESDSQNAEGPANISHEQAQCDQNEEILPPQVEVTTKDEQLPVEMSIATRRNVNGLVAMSLKNVLEGLPSPLDPHKNQQQQQRQQEPEILKLTFELEPRHLAQPLDPDLKISTKPHFFMGENGSEEEPLPVQMAIAVSRSVDGIIAVSLEKVATKLSSNQMLDEIDSNEELLSTKFAAKESPVDDQLETAHETQDSEADENVLSVQTAIAIRRSISAVIAVSLQNVLDQLQDTTAPSHEMPDEGVSAQYRRSPDGEAIDATDQAGHEMDWQSEQLSDEVTPSTRSAIQGEIDEQLPCQELPISVAVLLRRNVNAIVSMALEKVLSDLSSQSSLVQDLIPNNVSEKPDQEVQATDTEHAVDLLAIHSNDALASEHVSVDTTPSPPPSSPGFAREDISIQMAIAIRWSVSGMIALAVEKTIGDMTTNNNEQLIGSAHATGDINEATQDTDRTSTTANSMEEAEVQAVALNAVLDVLGENTVPGNEVQDLEDQISVGMAVPIRRTVNGIIGLASERVLSEIAARHLEKEIGRWAVEISKDIPSGVHAESVADLENQISGEDLAHEVLAGTEHEDEPSTPELPMYMSIAIRITAHFSDVGSNQRRTDRICSPDLIQEDSEGEEDEHDGKSEEESTNISVDMAITIRRTINGTVASAVDKIPSNLAGDARTLASPREHDQNVVAAHLVDEIDQDSHSNVAPPSEPGHIIGTSDAEGEASVNVELAWAVARSVDAITAAERVAHKLAQASTSNGVHVGSTPEAVPFEVSGTLSALMDEFALSSNSVQFLEDEDTALGYVSVQMSLAIARSVDAIMLTALDNVLQHIYAVQEPTHHLSGNENDQLMSKSSRAEVDRDEECAVVMDQLAADLTAQDDFFERSSGNAEHEQEISVQMTPAIAQAVGAVAETVIEGIVCEWVSAAECCAAESLEELFKEPTRPTASFPDQEMSEPNALEVESSDSAISVGVPPVTDPKSEAAGHFVSVQMSVAIARSVDAIIATAVSAVMRKTIELDEIVDHDGDSAHPEDAVHVEPNADDKGSTTDFNDISPNVEYDDEPDEKGLSVQIVIAIAQSVDAIIATESVLRTVAPDKLTYDAVERDESHVAVGSVDLVPEPKQKEPLTGLTGESLLPATSGNVLTSIPTAESVDANIATVVEELLRDLVTATPVAGKEDTVVDFQETGVSDFVEPIVPQPEGATVDDQVLLDTTQAGDVVVATTVERALGDIAASLEASTTVFGGEDISSLSAGSESRAQDIADVLHPTSEIAEPVDAGIVTTVEGLLNGLATAVASLASVAAVVKEGEVAQAVDGVNVAAPDDSGSQDAEWHPRSTETTIATAQSMDTINLATIEGAVYGLASTVVAGFELANPDLDDVPVITELKGSFEAIEAPQPMLVELVQAADAASLMAINDALSEVATLVEADAESCVDDVLSAAITAVEADAIISSDTITSVEADVATGSYIDGVLCAVVTSVEADVSALAAIRGDLGSVVTAVEADAADLLCTDGAISETVTYVDADAVALSVARDSLCDATSAVDEDAVKLAVADDAISEVVASASVDAVVLATIEDVLYEVVALVEVDATTGSLIKDVVGEIVTSVEVSTTVAANAGDDISETLRVLDQATAQNTFVCVDEAQQQMPEIAEHVDVGTTSCIRDLLGDLVVAVETSGDMASPSSEHWDESESPCVIGHIPSLKTAETTVEKAEEAQQVNVQMSIAIAQLVDVTTASAVVATITMLVSGSVIQPSSGEIYDSALVADLEEPSIAGQKTPNNLGNNTQLSVSVATAIAAGAAISAAAVATVAELQGASTDMFEEGNDRQHLAMVKNERAALVEDSRSLNDELKFDDKVSREVILDEEHKEADNPMVENETSNNGDDNEWDREGDSTQQYDSDGVVETFDDDESRATDEEDENRGTYEYDDYESASDSDTTEDDEGRQSEVAASSRSEKEHTFPAREDLEMSAHSASWKEATGTGEYYDDGDFENVDIAASESFSPSQPSSPQYRAGDAKTTHADRTSQRSVSQDHDDYEFEFDNEPDACSAMGGKTSLATQQSLVSGSIEEAEGQEEQEAPKATREQEDAQVEAPASEVDLSVRVESEVPTDAVVDAEVEAVPVTVADEVQAANADSEFGGHIAGQGDALIAAGVTGTVNAIERVQVSSAAEEAPEVPEAAGAATEDEAPKAAAPETGAEGEAKAEEAAVESDEAHVEDALVDDAADNVEKN